MNENREERKTQLVNTISSVTTAIENQLGDYKTKGKNILVIGGIMVAAYALARLLSDDETEEETLIAENKQEKSVFLSALTGVATTVLLSIAKTKLLDLLEQYNEKNEQ